MWIAAAGLSYYKARVYSPTLGRFLQTDPIGYGDGMNMYSYVGGDPVNFVDPSGLTRHASWTGTRIPSIQVGICGSCSGCSVSLARPNAAAAARGDGGGTFVDGKWIYPALGMPGISDGDGGATVTRQRQWVPGYWAPSFNESVRSPGTARQERPTPDFCSSALYIVSDALDEAGSTVTQVGGITIVAGVIQGALAPATAGLTGATGATTAAAGATLVGGGAWMQQVGKFGKFVASGSRYAILDWAVNALALTPALRKGAEEAEKLAGAATNAIIKTPGSADCGG